MLASSIFLPSLFVLFFIPVTISQASGGIYIDCGATTPTTYNGHEWLPDNDYTTTGTAKKILVTGNTLPILQTVRTFPFSYNRNKKFCYQIPVTRTENYLVRTTYFYGGVNGVDRSPPVFDQIVDHTMWSVVNTTEDFEKNLSTYYEGVFRAIAKTMNICLAVSNETDSDPFISSLEVVPLEHSLYNTTNFEQNGLSMVARHNFGHGGSLLRYPEDKFDRIWQPFGSDSSVGGTPNITVSGFWNIPPLKVFETRLVAPSQKTLDLQWPPGSLPKGTYYIALYFADDRFSSDGASRAFSVSINGMPYYDKLTVTSAGVAVFATQWPLSGGTNIQFVPSAGSDLGPLINAAEAFYVLPRGKRTVTRDITALLQFKRNLKNVPSDWNGDPCYPVGYSWTGITCSGGNLTRIISINLEMMGISGSLSPYIGNLTGLESIMLGNNDIYGPIPELPKLNRLRKLNLQNNHFSGWIPSSLGDLRSLTELHVEKNRLIGVIPKKLLSKPGLNFTFSPGNNFDSPSQPPS